MNNLQEKALYQIFFDVSHINLNPVIGVLKTALDNGDISKEVYHKLFDNMQVVLTKISQDHNSIKNWISAIIENK